MAYAAAYAEGECLINTCTAEDYAKIDEANALRVMERNNRKDDEVAESKSKAQKEKLLATSMDNFTKHLAKSKSLLQELQDKGSKHPKQLNEIYATISVPEIVKGLTAEDFK